MQPWQQVDSRQYQYAQQHSQRPMSAAAPVAGIPPFNHLHPAGPPPQQQGGSVSSRSRQSVGYLPTPHPQQEYAGPYPQLYTPHPMPRQKIYFGPYILLQTLGEGEFGKVKLGVHSERWGEDVAIKLIKRGNVDTAQRGEKVRREIEVLKAVRHPNIVRLYDVIETDKYIGIVLEYASGGELFDHILAHRHLKEKDAARLFAQLISAVSYLHRKGIVHRDLKLENLLLDRNRNVQVTDFGFANNFENAYEDLMATSCGSPCYAAPELVVQEGNYVGTAVDVWSCGVILYAMLAGYLPYDDDPNNPEGDNINLLYKYIINTPLIFPEWITDEPRELLLMMLVPEPTNRCTIEDVARHSWLAKYRPSFDRTVDQLEQEAQDLEQAKRRALELQRQWLIEQDRRKEFERLQRERGVQLPGLAHSHAPGMTRSSTVAGGAPSNRHRSAIVPVNHGGLDTFAEEGLPQSGSAASLAPIPAPLVPSRTAQPNFLNQSTNRRPTPGPGPFVPPVSPSVQSHRLSVEADPFSFETRSPPFTPSASPQVGPESVAMQPSRSAPPDAPAASEDQIMQDEDRGGYEARQATTSAVPVAVPSPTPSATGFNPPVALSTSPATVASEFLHAGGRSSRQSSLNASSLEVAAAAAGGPKELTEAEKRRRAANRVTVQVEYGGEHTRKSRTSSLASSSQGEGWAESAVQPEQPPPVPLVPAIPAGAVSEDVVMGLGDIARVEDRAQVGVAEGGNAPVLVGDRAAVPSPIKEEVSPTSTPASVEASVPFPVTPPRTPSATSALSASATSNGSTPKKRKPSGSPTPAPELPPAPKLEQDAEATPKPAKKTNAPPAAAAVRSSVEGKRPGSVASVTSAGSGSAASARRGHKPSQSLGGSIRSFLGGHEKAPTQAQVPPPLPSSATAGDLAGSTSTTGSTLVGGPGPGPGSAEAKTEKRKSRRQKAMSLQPFRAGTQAKVSKAKEPMPTIPSTDAREGARTRSSTLTPATTKAHAPGAMGPPPPRGSSSRAREAAELENRAPVRNPSIASSSATGHSHQPDLEAGWGAHGQPKEGQGKAKAVMDWFRRKSNRNSIMASESNTNSHDPPIKTDFDQLRTRTQSTTNTKRQSVHGPARAQANGRTPTPEVVVTPTLPITAAPGSTQSHVSQVTVSSSSSAVPAAVTAAPAASGAASSRAPTTTPSRALTAARPARPAEVRLREHIGAIDKAATTEREPSVVMQAVHAALWEMGVVVIPEGEFKLKCTRPRRSKAGPGSGMMTRSGSQGLVNALASSTSSGAGAGAGAGAGSAGMVHSPSHGLGRFFGSASSRKSIASPLLATGALGNSASPSMSSISNSPALTFSEGIDSPAASPAIGAGFGAPFGQHQQPQPAPVYGESGDSGDEVRFYVELTKVKNLGGLYYLEIKRSKGASFSFRVCYAGLLGRLGKGGKGVMATA